MTNTTSIPALQELETWAKVAWRLKGNVSFTYLNRDLLFLEFDFPDDAKRVLELGRRSFRGDFLQLEWWNPTIGCVSRKDQAKETWIRVVGLPLHLWTHEILRMLGDCCWGFLAIDEDTTLRTKTLWERMMVRTNVKEIPVGTIAF